jgi:hypothetical protein
MLKICAGFVTVLSLLFAFEEGYRIWANYRANSELLREQFASAQALVEVRDYETAWEILTEAQRANPGSSELRAAQINVAFPWLLEGFSIATGWIPKSSKDAPTKSPGEVADIVHSPLVVSSVLADGKAHAELEALVTWANLLRGREVRAERRDLGPDFRRARDMAPEAFTPNLLLGYWQAAFEGDPEAAHQSWDRALASDGDRALVRRFQVSVLGRAITNDDETVAYRHALLRVLDDMERRGEGFPKTLRLDRYLKVYVGPLARRLHFEAVADALDPERQLAVLEWVHRGFGIEPDKYGVNFEKFQLIRAHLLEQAGRPEEAVAAILDPGVELKNAKHLQALMDEAYERLTGRVPPDVLERDEWRGHAYYLTHAQPGDPRFDAAMEALDDWAGTWDQVGDSLIGGKLPPALDAAVIAWERRVANPDITSAERREAKETLRFLHFFRGHVRADSYDFTGGVAELEALARDPEASDRLRAETQFALAGAYTYSPRTPNPDFINSEIGWLIYEAYLYEGLDRLAAAIEAGFNDWDRIEKDLRRLRELSEYEPFSLRHGRVPRALENQG